MSVAYWSRPEINREFQAAPPDPGAFDLYRTQATEALYRSPFWSIFRSEELFQAKVSFENNILGDVKPKISAEEANERFGIPGVLTFDEPIAAEAAHIIQQRKVAEQEREFIISTGANTFGRKVAGFGVSMGAVALDPINLGAMFVPVVGEARFARMVQRTGGSLTKARLMRGAIEGFVGNAMVEPFVVLPALQEKANFGIKESALNLGYGTLLGAGMHTGLGWIADAISSGRMNSRLAEAQRTIQRLSPEDQDILFKTAMAEVLEDKPVTGPAKLAEVSDSQIAKRASFDSKQARNNAVRELGFDTDTPDTFNLYPDKSIPDPKPNEPWFHGRETGDLTFDKDRIAWFGRDPDFVEEMMSRAGEDIDNFQLTVFVANLEARKVAIADDVIRISKQDFSVEEAFFLLDDPNTVKGLKAEGFDTVLFEVEGLETMAVFNTDQIKTPGRRAKKTDTGIRFADSKDLTQSLERRTEALKEAKVKNLVNKERRIFQKEQALKEAARETKLTRARDPHTFTDPVIEKHALTIEDDIVALEDSFKVKRQEALIDPDTSRAGLRGVEKGTLEVVDDTSKRATSAIDQILEAEEFKSPAENEIGLAVSHGKNEVGKVIFKGDDLVAAISWTIDEKKGFLVVDHLGSKESGGGTRALLEAVSEAQSKDLDLKLQSTKEAEGFYEKLGLTKDTDAPGDFFVVKKEEMGDLQSSLAQRAERKNVGEAEATAFRAEFDRLQEAEVQKRLGKELTIEKIEGIPDRLPVVDEAKVDAFAVDIPDTFDTYPDKLVADPKANEPWFHGRPPGELVFDNDRPAFFARDPEFAKPYATRPFEEDTGNVFVANIEAKKPASIQDLNTTLKEIYNDFPGEGRVQNSKKLVDDIFEEGVKQAGAEDIPMQLPDALHVKKVRRALEKKGFDSFLGQDVSGPNDLDLLVVWDPEKITAPKQPAPEVTIRPEAKPAEPEFDFSPEERAFFDESLKGFEEPEVRESAIASAIDCVTRHLT